ncbi:MAG: guanylate kinase [Bacteroides sp.]|nr:guanylate kinase [Bacteroides sp.]
MSGKVIIFSAPSGSGKSTMVQFLMGRKYLNLAFSVSATSRPPRNYETNGVEYFFLTPDEFRQAIANDEFLEYVEVYENRFYGTLKAPIEAQLSEGKNIMFDVDVIGAQQIKDFYGDRSLSIFLRPPSLEELRRRLYKRGSDSPEFIEERLAKAEYELTFEKHFDVVIVNDDLYTAKCDILKCVEHFLGIE